MKLEDNSGIILTDRRTDRQTDRQRNSNIDLTRIFACIAVVGLHTFPREHSVGTLLAYYLCGFAIPFFFMSSGYFLLNRGIINWNYPLKKAFSIIRLVVLWNLVFDILKSVFKVYLTAKLNIEWLDIPQDIIKSFLQKGEMGHFWYLGALIIIYMLLPWISQKSLEQKKLLLFSMGIVCFTVQTVSLVMTYPLQAGVIQTFRVWTWLLYFLLGSFIEEITSCLKKKLHFNAHLIMVVVVTGIVLAVHYFVGTRVILLGGKILKAEYFYDSILDIIWVILFFSLLLRVKICKRVKEFIRKFASLTLGIYIIHFPLRLIVVRILKVNSLTEAVCFWLIVLIISAGITWIIGKIKIGCYLTKI